MILMEKLKVLKSLREQVHEYNEQVYADLKPHIEAWDEFVGEFAAAWSTAHEGLAVPWKSFTGDWHMPRSHKDATDVSLDRQNVEFTGQDYEGDWIGFVIPADFITDRKAAKARITAHWTRMAGSWVRSQQENERKQYELLKKKFEPLREKFEPRG